MKELEVKVKEYRSSFNWTLDLAIGHDDMYINTFFANEAAADP